MNNKLLVCIARLLTHCMIACTCVLYLVLRRIDLYSSEMPIIHIFTVLTSYPSIAAALIILIICTICFFRQLDKLYKFENDEGVNKTDGNDADKK